MDMDKRWTIALAGNPNCGKTTIFNRLTGSRQHVGNYSGVTVEKKEGRRRYKDHDFLFVDLPGTYSLTAYSLEEVVARNFIVEESPDAVVNVVDASNLERNLYLTVQLLELERPMVLALNMVDVAEHRGIRLDEKKLADMLGVTLVRTVGRRGRGVEGLLETLAQPSGQAKEAVDNFRIDYGPVVEKAAGVLETMLHSLECCLRFPKRWLALKLLENDSEVVAALGKLPQGNFFLAQADELRVQLTEELGEDPELAIADRRYQYVGEIYRKVILMESRSKMTRSDYIDRVLTHRLLGIPLFFAIMWAVFNLVFTVGAYPQDMLRHGLDIFSHWVEAGLPEGDLRSLIVDGIIGGVGNVLVFLPSILLLFLAIALLEDTGYMARAAFIMDRVMHRVGLHGKSFIPLLLGFGCNVPAIMGTRTLENPRDRLVTILVAPLMSCSARLPVYTVLIGAFFSQQAAGTVLFSIYLLGIVLAVVMARVFRSFMFPGTTEPFVMEMPPYRMPTGKSVMLHMGERSWMYLQKAGTLILAVSVLIWFGTNYPGETSSGKDYKQLIAQVETKTTAQWEREVFGPLQMTRLADKPELAAMVDKIGGSQDEEKKDLEETLRRQQPQLYPYAVRYVEISQAGKGDQTRLEREEAGEKLASSYAGQIGHAMEPILKPLGFNWKIGIALLAGFSAKEVLVSTLGTIYNLGDADKASMALQHALAADPTFNPLVAYGLMVFVLIYAPCMATIIIIQRETNSWRWAFFSLIYSTALAWFVAFLVYRGGLLLGWGV